MESALLSVAEAAKRLGVIPQRVRALIADGRLPAQRVGRRYVLDAQVVDRFAREPRGRGRPLSALNAWALLAFLSGNSKDAWAGRPLRSIGRIESLLNHGSDAVISALLQSEPRAQIIRWRVLPSDIRRLAQDPRLIKTGLSADAREVNVRYQRDRDGVDAYVSQAVSDQLERELHPVVGSPGANLVLRIPQGGDWLLMESVAPISVVAADLLNHDDPRVARAGRDALERLLH